MNHVVLDEPNNRCTYLNTSNESHVGPMFILNPNYSVVIKFQNKLSFSKLKKFT